MQSVLEGVTVLDMSRYIAGPYCASLLADFGARVIRVDKLGGSEDRQLLTLSETGDGSVFIQLNRNKESMTLDTVRPEGAEILKRLVLNCDVVVENLPQRALLKLGLDYESLRAINPRIIVANITAFGSKGPKSENLGFDGIGQAVSGAVYLGGSPDLPMKAAASYADFGTGLACAFGIMAALMARKETGQGQLVESSLLGTALSFISPFLIEQAVLGTNREARQNRSQLAAPADIYKTKDGWIIIQVLGQYMFRRWARLMGVEGLTEDPRFATDTLRATNAAELGRIMSEWSSRLSTADALTVLEKANVPAAAVMSPEQVLRDDHVKASGILDEVEYPGLPKPAPLVCSPVSLSETPGTIRTRAPLVGEHTDAILHGLGYSPQEIERLRSISAV